MTADVDDEDEDDGTRPDVFPARYRGKCADCGNAIDAGEPIYVHRFPTGGAARLYAHAHCPDADELEPIRADETRCPVCTAHHPGECF